MPAFAGMTGDLLHSSFPRRRESRCITRIMTCNSRAGGVSAPCGGRHIRLDKEELFSEE